MYKSLSFADVCPNVKDLSRDIIIQTFVYKMPNIEVFKLIFKPNAIQCQYEMISPIFLHYKLIFSYNISIS